MNGGAFLDFIKDEHKRGCDEHGWISITQAIQGAIERILQGYRDDEEARQTAGEFSDRGMIGYDGYGHPISPGAVADAVAEKRYLRQKKDKP